MADRGGFSRGFGRGGDRGGDRRGGDRRGGDRRGGRGGRRGGRGGAEDDLKNWIPITKLGRLVRGDKIKVIEDVYLHSLPIKEYQIVDHFFQPGSCQNVLKDDVMKIMPVQKQTRAGQRTRFKAFVAVGDGNGHCGLGVKCAKEVATAIRGAIIAAKLSLIPVRRGYWGNRLGEPHTVPMKVSGKCGSVRVRLIPAPRGTAIVGAPTTKKMLQFAGIKDCFSSARGSTKTRGNFMKALFEALTATYGYLTPDLWSETRFSKAPYQLYSDFLAETAKASGGLRMVTDAPVVAA